MKRRSEAHLPGPGPLAAGLVAVALVVTACSGGAVPAPGDGAGSPGGAATPASPPEEAEPFDPHGVRLGLRPVIEGLDSPLLVTHAGDGTGRLFVVEQGGRIRVVRDGRLLPEPFLDLTALTEAVGERGLLGLAFHPRYPANGRLFVNYTDNAGDTVVAEYGVDPNDPDRAQPVARVLLGIGQPYANHNGGNLVFGPDGYLYIGMGDGGSGGDPLEKAEDLSTLLGKMLRIDVDRTEGNRRYGIPPDNPFVDREGARPEIWAYGLRNPWRFSFDPAAGRLWIGDVGQGSVEEIDRTPADQGGLNYGWDVMEGDACYEPASGCDTTGLVPPIAVYSHELGCSITGGFVYRGSRFPVLRGGYLFADFCSGRVWALDAAGPSPQEPVQLLDTRHFISSFGEDEAGELYLTDLVSGEVFQVTAQPA
jgi:glucose/arabinose dehydrogenase